MTTIVVLSAGLSQPSSTRLLADRLADASREALVKTGDQPRIEVVELRTYARDLADHLVTGFPSAALQAVLDEVAEADAVIAVTPTFSASYSGLFKMFFDVLPPLTLRGKPVLIAATGGSARHSLMLDHALRPLFAYLRAVVLPTGVYAASEDWSSPGELHGRIERAAEDLVAVLGRTTSAPTGPPDPYADVTSFEGMLGGQRRA